MSRHSSRAVSHIVRRQRYDCHKTHHTFTVWMVDADPLRAMRRKNNMRKGPEANRFDNVNVVDFQTLDEIKAEISQRNHPDMVALSADFTEDDVDDLSDWLIGKNIQGVRIMHPGRSAETSSR